MYRIAVTNRHLCEGDFLERIRQIAQGDEYNAILLREKDLSHEEYEELAKKVLKITNLAGKKCILHPFVHIPLSVMAQMSQKERENLRKSVKEMSTSIHSLEQLKEAEAYSMDFVIAGHIFATDCKKDLPPRGLSFLKNICDNSEVPVYAIGGMTKEREPEVMRKGASVPIKIQDSLPAQKILENENIFVMTEYRAMHQDIRPLHVLILNLMPTKIETETQLLRKLSNTPLQVDVEFMQTSSYKPTHVAQSHLETFYRVFDDIKDRNFDGMIITGARGLLG